MFVGDEIAGPSWARREARGKEFGVCITGVGDGVRWSWGRRGPTFSLNLGFLFKGWEDRWPKSV